MLTGRMRDAMSNLVNVKGYCSEIWQSEEVTLLLAEAWLALGTYKRIKDLYDPNLDRKRGGRIAASTSTSSASNHAGSGSGHVATGSSGNLFLSKLNAARGVAYLAEGMIKEASNSFLAMTGDLTNEFNQVLSKEDIALYGGLTSLIALDRREMAIYFSVNNKDGMNVNANTSTNTNTGSNSSFRERLDAYPDLRDAIQSYIHADYGACLKSVDRLRSSWTTDLYLGPQADELWRMVRGKCLVQYFEPYSAVSLHAVMDSFAFQNVEELEDVVAELLERKEIVGAKIDGVQRTLHVSSAGALERRRRRVMVRKLARMGDRLLDEVEDMLLRMACLEKGVIVGKSGAKTRKSRGRIRAWGDAMMMDADPNARAAASASAWGLEDSSDEDGAEARMEVEEIVDDPMMDTDPMGML